VGFGAAGFLNDGVDVDAALGEDGREAGDDAGAVFYEKTQIVFGAEIVGDERFLLGGLAGVTSFAATSSRDPEDVGDDCHGGGMTAGAVSAENGFAAVLAGGDQHILAAFDARQR